MGATFFFIKCCLFKHRDNFVLPDSACLRIGTTLSHQKGLLIVVIVFYQMVLIKHRTTYQILDIWEGWLAQKLIECTGGQIMLEEI